MPAFNFSKAVDGSAVQLSASEQTPAYGFTIKAGTANSGVVYVGVNSNVTAGTAAATDGVPLAAGDSIFIPKAIASDVTGIYCIGSAAGQKVFVIGC